MKRGGKIIYWTPRILSILFICFLTMFSFDVFKSGKNAGEILFGLLIHNIPSIILAVLLAIAWSKEIVGAISYFGAGLLYIIFILSNVVDSDLPWHIAIIWSLTIAGPAFVIGALFLVNWKKRKAMRSKSGSHITAKDEENFPFSDSGNSTTSTVDSAPRINEQLSMPCYCGHDCARCVTYAATKTDDNNLREQSRSFYKESFGLDIPLEKFNCEGGRSDNVFELCRSCPFVKCCKEHCVNSCGECPDYPCNNITDYQAKYVNKRNQL